MASGESVSVHVRRGDYMAKGYASFFGTVEPSYYTKAIQNIVAQVEQPRFFVFSDQVSWCKANLNLPGNTVFVEHNTGEDSYKDLILMSKCRHNIMANSSFSWWGAWLNQNPNKRVMAPKQWFRQDYYDGHEPVYPVRQYNTNDLIPEGWIRV